MYRFFSIWQVNPPIRLLSYFGSNITTNRTVDKSYYPFLNPAPNGSYSVKKNCKLQKTLTRMILFKHTCIVECLNHNCNIYIHHIVFTLFDRYNLTGCSEISKHTMQTQCKPAKMRVQQYIFHNVHVQRD